MNNINHLYLYWKYYEKYYDDAVLSTKNKNNE